MGLLNAYAENIDPNGSDPGGGGSPPPSTPPPPLPTFSNTPGAPGGTPINSQESGWSGYTPPKGGSGGVTGIGDLFPNLKFGPVPKFSTPGYVPLDAASVLKDPGYQFRIQQGEEGLQRSAASKGLLRSGGTLKDLVQYDQNFASNEYNQAEDRNRAAYSLNYQLSKDEYAPLLAEWNTMSAAQLQKALAMYNRGTIWGAPRGGSGGYPEQLLPFGG